MIGETEKIDIVFSGSGTLGPCHTGCVARLIEHRAGVPEHEIIRAAGTSGGAIVAAGIAFGISTKKQLKISQALLSGGDLLDRSWAPWNGAGIHSGDKIHKLLRKHFPGKMSDADIEWGVFVSDLWTQKPVFINSKDHPDVPVADALRASVSIPIWFKAVKVKGFGEHLFVDGGVEVNHGMGVWDDSDRRTVGVRFTTKRKPTKIKPWQFITIVKTVLSMLIDNINKTYVSNKRWQDVIEINSSGDAMDFSLTEAEVQKLFDEGYKAADDHLSARREVIH